MDVGQLLREARERLCISQAELATRAGTDRAQISRYESGKASPTVRTLDHLLAACELQVRATLEPLLADVDTRVEAVLSSDVSLDVTELPNLMLVLGDDPAGRIHPFVPRAAGKGAVRWVFDGHTSLQLQGLAFNDAATALAIVFDEPARWLLRALDVLITSNGFRLDALEAEREVIAASVEQPFFTLLGFLQVRLVDELPEHVHLALPWTASPVPVATVDAVERAYPALREVLERLRARRG